MSDPGFDLFVRTNEGQQFYDIVISDKRPAYVARKWGLSPAQVRHYRMHGRKMLKNARYKMPPLSAADLRKASAYFNRRAGSVRDE